jgi:hypothetical protein
MFRICWDCEFDEVVEDADEFELALLKKDHPLSIPPDEPDPDEVPDDPEDVHDDVPDLLEVEFVVLRPEPEFLLELMLTWLITPTELKITQLALQSERGVHMGKILKM